MDFWNIAIPALTFLAPAVACLYFTKGAKGRSVSEGTWGMVTFGMVMLISIFGLIRFESPVRLEFLWPFSAEPSGYFEFTIQLHWARYIWILFTNAILFGFSAFDGKNSFRGEGRALKFNFLAGASLCSSLAYLSENVLLSLMFLEIMVFLMHAFGIQANPKEGELERISYFKRSSFLFLALIALLGTAATGEFSTNSVVMLGLVLYVLSFIFSKQTFTDWSQLSVTLIQGGAVFFLISRIIREDMSPELWLPVSTIFAVFGVVFASLSLISVSALGSSFWLLFSMMGYLLFLRFSSGRPEDPFWGTFEAIALCAVYALSSFFRFGKQADQGWKRALYFALSAILLAIVFGAIPGVDITGARATLESPIKLVTIGLLSFLISLVVGKSVVVSFSAESGKGEDGLKFLSGILPALTLLLLQIGAVLRITDLYGESPFRMGPAYLLTNPHIATMGAAVLAGLFSGLLLGANAGFVKRIRNKERRMEDFFPRIDPMAVAWNEKTFQTPEKGMDWLSKKLSHLSAKSAAWVQNTDNALFGEKLYLRLRGYSDSLSLVTRYFHSGSVRAYMFLGILITLFGAILFLWEGR